MRNIPIFVIITTFVANCSFAQSVIMDEDVFQDTLTPKNGPNYKNYFHWHFNYGLILGESEGSEADIMPGNSYNYQFGIRYKRKLAEFYALGFELNFDHSSFRIAQNPGKTFITSILYDKQKINSNKIELQIYQRFNFGKRGNYMGKYLDLAGYGSWAFNVTHYTMERNVTANGYPQITETTYRGLTYVNPFIYGVAARLGFNKLAVYGKYRFSDMFRSFLLDGDTTTYPELPRFIVGIEIGIIG